jgi:hypothetical protein
MFSVQFDVEQHLFHQADRNALSTKLIANHEHNRRRALEGEGGGEWAATPRGGGELPCDGGSQPDSSASNDQAAAAKRVAAANQAQAQQAQQAQQAESEAGKGVEAKKAGPVCAGCSSCDFGASSMWVIDYEQPTGCTPAISTALACGEYGGTWCGGQ